MSLHELTLNGLDLDGPPSLDGYSIRVLAEGFEPGSHEAVMAVVAALGADGSSSRFERAENAESAFQVQITGPDHLSLAEGEAALRRAFPGNEEIVPLIHRPSDGHSPASVRDIVRGSLAFDFDDLDEASSTPIHTYTVTLEHLPFVRSEFPTVIPATADPVPVPTTVVVDDCTSATGWTALTYKDDGTSGSSGPIFPTPVTASGGAVRYTMHSGVIGAGAWRRGGSIVRTGAVDMSATPYLVAEVSSPSMALYVGGVRVVADLSRAIDGGYVRNTYDLSAHPAITKLEWAGPDQAWPPSSPRPPSVTISVRHIERTDDPNPQGRPRQIARTFEIGGTERSPGSVHIWQRTGSDPLGLTLLHISPSVPGGYDPDLTRWENGAATPTSDPTVPAGRTFPLGGVPSVVAQVPSSAFPEGPYAIGAFIKSGIAQSVTFTTTVAGSIPGSTVFREIRQQSKRVTFAADTWTYVSLAMETLPALRGPMGGTWVAVSSTGAASSLTLGGWWAFSARDGCSLSIADGEQPHLWFDSPEVGSGADVWMSATASRMDGYSAPGAIVDAGLPVLSPGPVTAYVVTKDADNAASDHTHYQRWTWHAADDGTRE